MLSCIYSCRQDWVGRQNVDRILSDRIVTSVTGYFGYIYACRLKLEAMLDAGFQLIALKLFQIFFSQLEIPPKVVGHR